ncbi:AraC family transcriptional regulator [Paenibacillus sp.]|uniref:AraC family transcriptional regulator n=1 Tax=Paenibacillus sp. TaxID=58172 RepID=UPI0028112FF9|nr:AraC family transcriptional regulator [Paenibacillus sp.]
MLHLWPKQTYLRIFFLIAVSFVVLVVPFSFYLSGVFSNHAYKEIDRFNEQRLRHTLQNTQFLADKLKAYSLHIYWDPYIQKWFQSPDDLNRGTVQNEALIALTKYITNEPFIYSAYLVNIQTESVIDYRSRKYAFDEFFDADILSMIGSRSSRFLQFFPHESNGHPVFALIVPSSQYNRYDGYLVVLLDRLSLEKYLLQNNDEEGIETVVSDAEGRIILGTQNEGLQSALKPAGPTKPSGQYDASIAGRTWSVNFVRVPSTENWTIYYMTEKSRLTAELGNIQRTILWGSVLLLALLLAVSFWNARITFRPYSALVEKIKNKWPEDFDVPDASEYMVLEKGIHQLTEKVAHLRSAIHRHKSVIKAESIRQWLLQGKLMAVNRQELAEETALLTYSRFYVAIFRIDHYKAFCEAYNFDSRKLFIYAMQNIAAEILSGGDGCAEYADIGSDHLAFVIGSEDETPDRLAELLAEAVEQIRKFLKIDAIASVSAPKTGKEDFREVYDRTYELTMLKFLSGDSKIYREEDLESYSDFLHSSDEDLTLASLIESVRFGRMEQVERQVADLIRHLQSLSYDKCRFQLQIVFYNLYRAFGHLTSVESLTDIQSLIQKFSTLSELRSWLEEELKSIIGHLNRNLNQPYNIKDEHVKEIVGYINTRLNDPNLSANDIADHVSLSVGYMRQLFKETLQMTVSDYILTSRIDYVKELMKTSSYSVTEIAESAGFLSKSHFFTTFKKMTGMTPNEYRKYL